MLRSNLNAENDLNLKFEFEFAWKNLNLKNSSVQI